MHFTSGKDGETWIIQHDEVFMLGGGGTITKHKHAEILTEIFQKSNDRL